MSRIDREAADKVRKFLEKNHKIRKEHSERLAQRLIKIYLREHQESAAKKARESIKAKKKTETDIYMGLGLGSANERARLGEGTRIKNQKEVLAAVGEGLNETQKADMLRAALQAGFDATIVFGFVKTPERTSGRELPVPLAAERDRTTQQLIQIAILTATRLNREMQLARMAVENDDTEDNRERYEASKIRLRNFLGSKASVDDLIKLGSTETDVVTRAIMGQVAASYNLHTGKPSGVVPKRARRRRAA